MMILDDAMADGQAQTGSFDFGLRRIKWLEDTV